jgi:hypothetical protein
MQKTVSLIVPTARMSGLTCYNCVYNSGNSSKLADSDDLQFEAPNYSVEW